MAFYTTEPEQPLHGNYTDQLCRGGELEYILKELLNGNHASVFGVVGGFSDDLQTCRRFTKRSSYDELQRISYSPDKNPEIPAVIRVEKHDLKERNPTLTKVEYDAEWLLAHPDIAEHISTTAYCKAIFGSPEYKADMRKEAMKCIADSAKTYQFEHEWVVTDTDIVNLKPAYSGENVFDHERFPVGLDIYMDANLARALNKHPKEHGKDTLEEFADELKLVADRLEQKLADDKRFTDDMLDGLNVKLIACTVDMQTEFSGINPESQFVPKKCYIHSRLHPLERRRRGSVSIVDRGTIPFGD